MAEKISTEREQKLCSIGVYNEVLILAWWVHAEQDESRVKFKTKARLDEQKFSLSYFKCVALCRTGILCRSLITSVWLALVIRGVIQDLQSVNI